MNWHQRCMSFLSSHMNSLTGLCWSNPEILTYDFRVQSQPVGLFFLSIFRKPQSAQHRQLCLRVQVRSWPTCCTDNRAYAEASNSFKNMTMGLYFNKSLMRPQYTKHQKRNYYGWRKILQFCSLVLWEQNLLCFGLVIMRTGPRAKF
jgi:hypothetical protein